MFASWSKANGGRSVDKNKAAINIKIELTILGLKEQQVTSTLFCSTALAGKAIIPLKTCYFFPEIPPILRIKSASSLCSLDIAKSSGVSSYLDFAFISASLVISSIATAR